MKLKSLKIHIQHSPINGDPNEWIMDIQADGDFHREISLKASTVDALVYGLEAVIKEIRYGQFKTLWSEVFKSTGESAAGL